MRSASAAWDTLLILYYCMLSFLDNNTLAILYPVRFSCSHLDLPALTSKLLRQSLLLSLPLLPVFGQTTRSLTLSAVPGCVLSVTLTALHSFVIW